MPRRRVTRYTLDFREFLEKGFYVLFRGTLGEGMSAVVAWRITTSTYGRNAQYFIRVVHFVVGLDVACSMD